MDLAMKLGKTFVCLFLSDNDQLKCCFCHANVMSAASAIASEQGQIIIGSEDQLFYTQHQNKRDNLYNKAGKTYLISFNYCIF